MPTKPKGTPGEKRATLRKKPSRPKKTGKPARTIPAQSKAHSVEPKPKARSIAYVFAVGRRKTAVARVRRVAGESGVVTVNGLPLEQYFGPADLRQIVRGPIELVAAGDPHGYSVKVAGGGTHSQAEAIRHGIARVLLKANPDWRVLLKQAGWLRRDARVKERKKPGLHRARRAPQWQKR